MQISLRLQIGGKNMPELKAREVLFTTTNEQRSSDVHKWWQNTIVSLRRPPPPPKESDWHLMIVQANIKAWIGLLLKGKPREWRGKK